MFHRESHRPRAPLAPLSRPEERSGATYGVLLRRQPQKCGLHTSPHRDVGPRGERGEKGDRDGHDCVSPEPQSLLFRPGVVMLRIGKGPIIQFGATLVI